MATKIDKQALRQKIQDLQIDNNLKSELLAAICEQKTFGLVWEEKDEEAQDILRDNIPVLKEVTEKRIVSGGQNAPNHVLIEAENLHALTALVYSHEGKFDAIYIDPPYNSGATDWKYNNDYVDKEDLYRHSKWISMMEHRLNIAKKLLNPINSVLIVTIDEKEFLHLGCLLEQIFPYANIQMVSDAINRKGSMRQNGFQKTDEYIFFVNIGEASPLKLPLDKEWTMSEDDTIKSRFKWQPFIRGNFRRYQRPKMFYPIFTDIEGSKILRVGRPLEKDQDRNTIIIGEGERAIFPLTTNGEESVWHLNYDSFLAAWKKGYVKLGKGTKTREITISYLSSGTQKMIEEGVFDVTKRNSDGSISFDTNDYVPEFVPGSQWRIKSHDATSNGTKLLSEIIGNKFSYPKSLFSVHDAIRFYLDDKPNAEILDFFAGSGTTLHATMLLNSEDKGARRCILVTNNESNICEDVTYERNKKVIEGYISTKDKAVNGFVNNNLRYYKTEFVSRENTSANRRALISSCIDLLCLKENIYTETESFGGRKFKKSVLRYFEDGDKQMLVVLDERAISLVIPTIAEIAKKESPMKVFVFSDGQYAYEDEFHEVMPLIDLCALPDAIYQSLNNVLPERKYSKEMIAEFNEEDANAALEDTYNYRTEEGGVQ